MLSNFPQVTQLVSGRAEITPRSASFQNHSSSKKRGEALRIHTETKFTYDTKYLDI